LKTITRRLERLERKVNVVVAPKSLPFDYDLLTPKEQDLSSVTHLLHDKAVELGYGKFEACRYHFVRNPWLDHEVFEECVAAFTDEERLRYERANEIYEKCRRLTLCLTEEEKAMVKQYNEVSRFFGSSLAMNGAEKGWWKGHTKEELEELRVLYEQIMAKHGERIYE